jgi:hypothetical protein
MDQERKDEQATEIENVDIAPLSDEDLDAVAGGVADGDCSCIDTTGCCTSCTVTGTELA